MSLLSVARNVPLADNTCYEAITKLTAFRPGPLTAVCNADPLIAGKTVTMTYASAPTSAVWTVTSITATAPSQFDQITTVGLMIVACALMFSGFFGYRNGHAST